MDTDILLTGILAGAGDIQDFMILFGDLLIMVDFMAMEDITTLHIGITTVITITTVEIALHITTQDAETL